jgi:predicted branched-subunit amino acid permease
MTTQQTTSKSAFWAGYRDCSPFLLVAAPFALLFGVAATEAGFDLVQTMVMTVLVIAGAAQFTALVLLQENAPTLIILTTALAVNLRMAMYSAALVPYLGKASPRMKMVLAYFNVDQSFGLAMARFPNEPNWTTSNRCAYFIGAALAIMPAWVTFSFIGAVFGATIPDAFALDFALPICFLALVAPALRSLPHIAAAGTSVVGALSLSWVPYSMGLIIAAVIAMAVGAQVELWVKKRAT